MSKILIIVSLLFSMLMAQSDDIPYDWSGQYGVISNDGRVMWNQDWTSGVLFFDGSFANYPTRYGQSYSNNFKINSVADFYDRQHKYPDSTLILSKINYHRGDFSYDQLEFDIEFAEKNRIITLNGFKRNYGGAYGQYVNSGSENPLQQSYRLDYFSKDKNESIDISIGYFKTDSRLTYKDEVGVIHKDNILAVGVGYSKEFSKLQYNIHSAFFQQDYKNGYVDRELYLNRFHINQFVNKSLNNSDIIKFGVQLDKQSSSLIVSRKKDRLWSTIYSGWEKQNIGTKIGLSLAEDEAAPYYNIWANSSKERKVNWQSYLKYEAIPEHIDWDGTYTKLFEKWFTGYLGVSSYWKEIPISVNVMHTSFKEPDYKIDDQLIDGIEIHKKMLTSSISTQIPLVRDWKIDAQYRHTFEHNFYSDGIGDRIILGIIINENFFKSNMQAQLKLWGDAYLNHDNNNYSIDTFGSFFSYDSESALPDYWVFNMELSAKISKMTINWRINNLLQTLKSISNDQLFSNIDEKFLLINNNNNFPPLNRFMALNIIWEFNN